MKTADNYSDLISMDTEMPCMQLSLPLFTNVTFEEIICSKKICDFSVKLSARLKRSWYLKINRQSGMRTLTVPAYLKTAPSNIKASLIEWSLLAQYSKKKKLEFKHQRIDLEKQIQSYIGNLAPTLCRSTLDITRLEQQTNGIRYDLRDIFDTINNSYFNNSVTASVRWGSSSSLTSYQTTRTAKNGETVNLITIAGVYNHPNVPRFALEAVMHHEMLHIVIPPYIKNKRRIVHGTEFKQMERQFAYYKQWCEWEKTSLRALAISLKKRRFRYF